MITGPLIQKSSLRIAARTLVKVPRALNTGWFRMLHFVRGSDRGVTGFTPLVFNIPSQICSGHEPIQLVATFLVANNGYTVRIKLETQTVSFWLKGPICRNISSRGSPGNQKQWKSRYGPLINGPGKRDTGISA